MAEGSERPMVRFDRRKVEIPQAEGEFNFAAAPVAARRPSRWPYALLTLIIAGLGGALGYGYILYETQNRALLELQRGNEPDPSLSADETAASITEQPALVSDIALERERDDAIAALALARQRISALQAELGVPATGRPELGDVSTTRSDTDDAQRMDALTLEVRLLTRERDAARAQIDGMLASMQNLANETGTDPALARANARLSETVTQLEADIATQSLLVADSAEVIDQLNARLVELESEAKQTQTGSIDELQARQDVINDLELQLAAAQSESQTLRETVIQSEKATVELQSAALELADMKTLNASLTSDLSNLEARGDELVDDRDAVRAELSELKEAQLDASGLSARFGDELAQKDAELAALTARIDDLQQERDEALARLESLESLPEQADSTANQDKITELTEALAAAQARITAFEVIDRSGTTATSDSDVNQELQSLRDRQQILETLLARFTPAPPRPAPR